MIRRWHSLLLLLLLAATPAFAQSERGAPPESAQAVPWSSLSPDQQKLLSRFGNQWNNFPPERQQALARGSHRWLGMSAEQKGLARSGLSHDDDALPGLHFHF